MKSSPHPWTYSKRLEYIDIEMRTTLEMAMEHRSSPCEDDIGDEGFSEKREREEWEDRGRETWEVEARREACLNRKLADPGIIIRKIWIGLEDPKSDCLAAQETVLLCMERVTVENIYIWKWNASGSWPDIWMGLIDPKSNCLAAQ